MVAQLIPAPHPIVAAITSARDAVAGVRDVQPVFMSPAEKEAAVTEIARLEARTAELKLRILAAAGDAAEPARRQGRRRLARALVPHGQPGGRSEARLADALDRTWTRSQPEWPTVPCRCAGPDRRARPRRTPRRPRPRTGRERRSEDGRVLPRLPAQRASPTRPPPARGGRTRDRRGRGSQKARGRGATGTGEASLPVQAHRRRDGPDHDRPPRTSTADRLLTYLESFTSPRKAAGRDQRRGGPDPSTTAASAKPSAPSWSTSTPTSSPSTAATPPP